MKTTHGKPYTKPSTIPTFTFIHKNGARVEVYETFSEVQVFQTTEGHQQRIVMSAGDFDNFYSRLLLNGFTQHQYHEV